MSFMSSQGLRKVAQSIREQSITHGLEDQIEEVMVPTENVVEVRRGVRVEGERKFSLDIFWLSWNSVMKLGRWLPVNLVLQGSLVGKAGPYQLLTAKQSA